MWDSSDPNSIEELEEVTADEFNWPMPQSGVSSSSSGGGGGGRRGRKASVPDDAECLVCRLSASGNNFGVATCESCKTFFRRNAKRELSQIRCLHYNNCNVVKEYRRSCTACRLRKCFAVGMRKELILSEEKLRTRARPTFKKPRYRWCRIPASVDVDQLLTTLQAGSRPGDPPVRVKLEAAEPCSDEAAVRDDESPPRSPSEADCCSPSASVQFESSPICQRLFACISNYRQPYDSKCAPSLQMKILHLEDGFACMDNPIRKMIRLIPELPHFHQLEKALLGRIIKLRVFGALQIINLLNFDPVRDAWVLPVESRQGTDEAVVDAREGVFNTFMSLTKHRLMDGRALYTVSDVERMYVTITGFYREILRVSGEHNRLVATVLLALYLLEEDVSLALSDAEKSQLRQTQWHYLGYLDDVTALCQDDQQAVSYTSKRLLLLLMQIRWLETCYIDAAKSLQISRVPPLIQELVAD